MGTDHRIEHHVDKMGTLHVQGASEQLFLPERRGGRENGGKGRERMGQEGRGKMSG